MHAGLRQILLLLNALGNCTMLTEDTKLLLKCTVREG